VVSATDVERLIGVPVEVEIPNDPRELDKALQEAKPVSPNTDLGKCFHGLANRILSRESGPSRAKRFVEYFSLSPAQYSLGTGSKSTG
jgi:hypothetical protein